MIRTTKPLNKNSLSNLICPLIFSLLIGFILPECSHTLTLKKNISTTIAPIQEKSIIPEQLKVLNFNAAVKLTTLTSELRLFAAITYRSVDTLTIQLKDPLKRQLAKIEISNGEYQLWLQREGKYYSGLEWPDLKIDYEIPEIPVACLPAILIGLPPPTQNLTTAPAITYQYTYNKLHQLKTLTAQKEQQPLVKIHYDNYHQLESGFWLPSLLKIKTPQGINITIQYSQFRYELIKLA